MLDFIKNLSKDILSPLGIFLSHNQRYDWQLKKIIEGIQPNQEDIALIDVGAHKGEVTDLCLRNHKANCLLFEPIPILYERIQKKYQEQANVQVFNIGLANEKKQSTFQYNHSHPAYSGIRRRSYPSEQDEVEEIVVNLDTLDNVLTSNNRGDKIHLIKIDVEGAEMKVLEGASNTIFVSKPLVVFEHGLGASEYYETKPEMIFAYFEKLNMGITTMENWLNKKAPRFTLEAFKEQFYDKLNYYFIAFPL